VLPDYGEGADRNPAGYGFPNPPCANWRQGGTKPLVPMSQHKQGMGRKVMMKNRMILLATLCAGLLPRTALCYAFDDYRYELVWITPIGLDPAIITKSGNYSELP